MNSSIPQLTNYKNFLLNKHTDSIMITEYIEQCALNEIYAANHSFHKIMVFNWTDTFEQLFNTMSDYFEAFILPINTSDSSDMVSFYTSNLSIISKIIKLDYTLPYARNMYKISILFNKKSSLDIFGLPMTVDDIVNGVINRRFNREQDLDLSNFSNDPEFKMKRISFYKLVFLSHFKFLMLRMGKETKSLNLSNNNLSKVPLEILNFFIKGDLISIKVSDNNIQSLSDLSRVSSRIEKLWLEGNPLCDELDAGSYVKNVMTKFPRLTELDGVKLNHSFGMLPVHRNYLATPDARTKVVVDQFLTLFFSLYDNKNMCQKYVDMYDQNATFTLATTFTESDKQLHKVYSSGNFLNSSKPVATGNSNSNRSYDKNGLIELFRSMPSTIHDPNTFTVDVFMHNHKCLVMVVDGTFKEKIEHYQYKSIFRFRRTFVLAINNTMEGSMYTVMNDMLLLDFATEEQIQNSFMNPIVNFDTLAMVNPDQKEIEAIVRIFINCTNLKRHAAELHLKLFNWDIKEALKAFMVQVKNYQLTADKFGEEDFSDSSSILDCID